MKKRIIILVVLVVAMMAPGVIATELVRSYVRGFVEQIPDLAKLDDITQQQVKKAESATEELKSKAEKKGFGGLLEKATGEATSKAEEKIDKGKGKIADTGAEKASEQIAIVQALIDIPFPMFQVKLFSFFPWLSGIFGASLGLLSFGFLYCGRKHASEEE